MFLMGMVYFEESTNSYVAVGEAEFHEEIRRRSMAKNMKEVRRAMFNTLVDGSTSGSIPLSTNLVKVVTLLAMQPSGMHVDEVAFQVVETKYAYRSSLPTSRFSWRSMRCSFSSLVSLRDSMPKVHLV